MQRLALILVLLSVATGSDVTPIQKVIQLMEDMKKKGKKEMEAEQVQFAAFKQFCSFTLDEKAKAITSAANKIDLLSADIEKCGADIDRLTQEIAAHGVDVESAAKQEAAANKVRADEKAAFQTTLKDYTESIDAIGRAMKALKETNGVKAQASLLQLSSQSSLAEVKRGIDAFLEEGSDSDDEGAPVANGYESKSGGVIKMLQDLQDKFVDERVSLEKAEAQKQHSFDLLVQGLKAQQAASTKDKTEKTEFKAKTQEKKASSEGDLQETKAAKAADEKYRADLAATCEKKASDFDQRQKLRTEELAAIQKAIDIVAGGKVSGAGQKHSPKLVQTDSEATATALVSLRSNAASPGQQQVAEFLQREAAKLNSQVLSAIAIRVGADPLAKVKTMIEQLIVKMNEDMNAEATKKGWCDAELATNELTRKEKMDAVASLQSEMDQISALIAKLGEDTATLTKQISNLNDAMAKATQIRQAEKNKNTATIKDAKEAQAAVAQAVGVLKEFYAKAGAATAFVQTQDEQTPPAIFGDTPYTGMGSASGGVIGMMEVIQSDFAKLEAETSAAEQAAVAEYSQFMEDSKVDKAQKEKDVAHMTTKKEEKSQELNSRDGDLQGTQKELDAALAYFDKLKPDCLNPGADYAARKAQREREIKDLTAAVAELQKL